jgi:hypothetical protein
MTPEAEGKGASGFLFTLHDLIQAALAGRTPPISRSYVYHARTYTMTLKECRTIPQLKVSVKLHEGKGKIEKSYPRVNAARFQTVNSDTGERTDFRVAFASSGELKGVPVQVEYQPNWWFKVILNLNPAGAR